MARKILLGSTGCPTNNEFIVKTHAAHDTIDKYACSGKIEHAFKKAIYILRNPYNAIIAEFNRKHAGKTQTASPEKFQGKGMAYE